MFLIYSQLEEAEFAKEVSSHHQENGQDKTAHHESYNEDVDGASTLNNRDSFSFEGVTSFYNSIISLYYHYHYDI